jgi:Xaa-Pro aminopeptidase
MAESFQLAEADVTGRLGRLRPRLPDAGCEALLVTNLVNLRYLTGFTGSAGLLLVLPDEAVLTTDGRYRDQAAEQLEPPASRRASRCDPRWAVSRRCWPVPPRRSSASGSRPNR